MKRLKRALCLCITLMCIAAAATPAFAAQTEEPEDLSDVTVDIILHEPTEETQPPERYDSHEAAISELLAQDPEDALAPITQRPEVVETACRKQFSYPSDVMLSGIFETESLFFYVPKYWDCGYVYAQIEFTLSQMIQGDVPATLSFLVNNTPVYTCKMDYGYGRSQIVYVEIPTRLLREGYNTFEITGYVRLYDEEGCIDDFSGANWVHISKDSFVEVGYDVLPHQKSIARYPYPFVSSVDSHGSKTQVVVSDALENEELAAALLLRADLAAETDGEDAITLCRVRDMQKNATQTVLVSRMENLPEELLAMLTAAERADPRLKTSALIKFVEDAQGNPLLLITSHSARALMEGAIMLVDETRVTQERGSMAWVLENASQRALEARSENQLKAGRYTIEGITGSGLHYVGPYHQEYVVYLPVSSGYLLANASKISLNFRYSDNLDFRRSLITVYWGDVPVASKRLTQEGAGGDTLSFSMPADVIGTAASSLKIAFDLELPELFCTPRMEDMPWAYVTGDSSLYLPMGVSGRLSFDLRPFPFEEFSAFNDLLVAIPDEPTAVELDTLGRVIARYGENVTPYGSIQVQRASSLDAQNADYNIITLGTLHDNALIRQLNDRLAFPYREDGAAFLSSSRQVLSEGYAQRIALMELLPWEGGENRGILVVGGLNDAGMGLVNTFLRKDTNVWTLSQDTVLIDGSEKPRTYTALEPSDVQATPDLKTFLEQNQESVIFTVTATSAMLLLFLGCILILLRIYGRNGRDKK